MNRTLTLRDANQNFSRCVRAVAAGEEFVVTRNGKLVARLALISNTRVLSDQQKQALGRFREVAHEDWPPNLGLLDRDALHER